MNNVASIPAKLYIVGEKILLRNDSPQQEELASEAIRVIKQNNPQAKILFLGRGNEALSKIFDVDYLDMSDTYKIVPKVRTILGSS
jgi:hypothetical protein